MTRKPAAHRWQFTARFRRHAFGWRSQPAIQRVKEAVAEIRKVARTDPVLAAEGAVRFLERVSPALEHVDSSSGAIGTAVNRAIDELVPLIAGAPVDAATREVWLERLWEAYDNDQIPYIEQLGDYWGELCVSAETASRWADRLIGLVELSWSPNRELRGFFKGIPNCLSALLAAGRHREVLDLLDLEPHRMWTYRQYGVKALAAMGRPDEAIAYAASNAGLNDHPVAIARGCENVLLSAGRVHEAYTRFGLLANRSATNLAWFRAVAKKYPHKTAAEILEDLVAMTPGEEGKWFAAAKDAGLYDEALALASRTPCDPRTLARAARDFAQTRPAFAVEAGMAALHWLAVGHGYEITSADVWAAYRSTIEAAERHGMAGEVKDRIRQLLARDLSGGLFLTRVLGAALGCP